jgi:hypothetical protein
MAFFGLAILGLFLILFFGCIYSYRLRSKPDALSPYSQLPLRRARDLSYYSKEKVLRYLYNLHEFDNRIFKFNKASFCRETGRIFQNSVTWFDTIDLDWTFLQKRFNGHFVSWGSLSDEQRAVIAEMHESLDEFQTAFSSPTAAPKGIEKKFAFTKPGPLYVDPATNILLGWKIVPGTDLEVLIVQKPIKYTTITIEQ